jgi:pimeloyl-ACP methyl ester carboxylesterase
MQLCRRCIAGERLRNDPPPGGAPADILIAPSPQADRVILVFASGPGRFQEMDNPVFLHRTDASLIFLRNRTKAHYLDGIQGVGADYDACVAGFRRIFEKLQPQPRRVYCVGHSISGYAALRFGLDLGADGVFCTSPYTTLDARAMPPDAPPPLEMAALAAERTAPIAPLYRAAASPPKATLCYGAANRHDSRMAQEMADIPGVTLVPIPGLADHNSLIEVVRRGDFARLIEAMLAR